MESREEIQAMRVADLRNFLRRHGTLPTSVTRDDGTPGQPRKADLLRAALAIEIAARTDNWEQIIHDPLLSPYSPQVTPLDNPFQSRRISPAKPKAVSLEQKNQGKGLVDRVQTPARIRSAKQRRSSGAWVDPMLLLATPTSKTPQTTSSDAKKTPNTGTITATENKPSSQQQDSVQKDTQMAREMRFSEIQFNDDDEDPNYDADKDNDENNDENYELDDNLNDISNEVAALGEDASDFLIQSDVGSDVEHVPFNGDDSTIETDEEDTDNAFEDYDVPRLREWLGNYGVMYARRAGRSELISLARGHSLQMEMQREMERVSEERKRSGRVRRRRTITAPCADDDDGAENGDDEIRTAERSNRPRTRLQTKRESVALRRKHTRKRSPKWPQVRVPWTFVMVIAAIVLFSMTSWSIITIYRSHNKPFCDTGKTSSSIDDGYGCRKCPEFGICEEGVLGCEGGYIPVGAVCVEDQESSIMAETIAHEVNNMLSNQAGLAECGQAQSPDMALSELREASRIVLSDRPSGGIFDWSGRTFQMEKFDIAFEKAIERLRDKEDFPSLSVSVGLDDVSDLVYKSSDPTYTWGCLARVIFFQYLRVIVGCFITLLIFIYVKIALYFKRKDEEKLDLKYNHALELLREQKANFVRNQEEFAFLSDIALRQEVLGHPSLENIQFWKRVEVLLKNDSRLTYAANRTVNGMPSNTYEWRSRVSRSNVFASGGSLRDFDSPGTSASRDSTFTVHTPRPTWFGAVQRRLFNNQQQRFG